MLDDATIAVPRTFLLLLRMTLLSAELHLRLLNRSAAQDAVRTGEACRVDALRLEALLYPERAPAQGTMPGYRDLLVELTDRLREGAAPPAAPVSPAEVDLGSAEDIARDIEAHRGPTIVDLGSPMVREEGR